MYLQVSQISVWEEATEIYSGFYFSSEHQCELHQKAKFSLDKESWQLSQIIIKWNFKHFERCCWKTGVQRTLTHFVSSRHILFFFFKQRCAFLTITSFRAVLRKKVTWWHILAKASTSLPFAPSLVTRYLHHSSLGPRGTESSCCRKPRILTFKGLRKKVSGKSWDHLKMR